MPLTERFAQAAAAHPDRQAVVCESGEITFAQLSRRATAIAALLREHRAGREAVVGVYLPRGIEQVTSIFGVLLAGAAYLPLDPSLPPDRITYMLQSSQVRVVLSHSRLAGQVPAAGRATVLSVDKLRGSGQAPDGPVPVSPDNLCYVIYTSGSTGQPKGVQVTHGGVAALLDALEARVLPAADGCRVGWNASMSFDASVQQWIRLCRGDTVVLLGEQLRMDPEAIIRLIVSERLTDLDITPTHLGTLIGRLEDGEAGSRAEPLRLLVGGEAIPPQLWNRLAGLGRRRIARCFNLYGPSECTVEVTAATVAGGTPVIGDELPGATAYVLDRWLRPVRDGEAGELFIAGPGVCRGYRGAPGLTAQRFLPDVFARDGSRMYRTGDRARRHGDGSLEYLGRTDLQVKVRGFRVEPGEVETALARVPGVAQAVVVLREDLPGGPGLAAYCRFSDVGQVTPARVRAAVRAWLPEYMVPTVIVPVDSFPMNVSAKADRATLSALPLPVSESGAALGDAGDGTERLVAEVWSELLGTSAIGADDNFFLLGGNSLLAYRLAARLRRLTGQPVPLLAVFENPVLREFAAAVQSAGRVTAAADR